MATKNGVPYVVDLVPEWKWNIKCPEWMQAKKITVHNTDNQMDAKSEITYMKNNNDETSYHIAVDENEARQGLPFNRNGWHSGDGYNGYGNRNTIGVEICRNYDRSRNTTNLLEPLRGYYSNAEKNAIKVIAQICVEQGIVANVDTIKRHYDWSGKWCPSKILNEGRWLAVQAAIIAEYIHLVDRQVAGAITTTPSAPATPKPAPGVVVKEYRGSFKANDTILVRDKPSTSGRHIATYKKGEVLDPYVREHHGNGYVWLEYDRAGGGKGYLPVRTYANGSYGDLWGVVGDVGQFTAAPKPALKSVAVIAQEVLDNKWDNDPQRSQKLKAAGYNPTAVQAEVNRIVNAKKKEYIFLPANNATWGVYYLNQAPVSSNIQGKYLAPAQYGGLEYEVLSWDQPDVAVISTGRFGKVKIFVGAGTNAKRYKK